MASLCSSEGSLSASYLNHDHCRAVSVTWLLAVSASLSSLPSVPSIFTWHSNTTLHHRSSTVCVLSLEVWPSHLLVLIMPLLKQRSRGNWNCGRYLVHRKGKDARQMFVSDHLRGAFSWVQILSSNILCLVTKFSKWFQYSMLDF